MDEALTTRELWGIWNKLTDDDIRKVVLPHIERRMIRAKEEHEFYAFTFFRFWRNNVMERVGAAS